MNTVYVIQDPQGKEILPAKEFGKIRVILGGREPAIEAKSKLWSVLKDMKANDYLLQIGSPLNIGIATHFALVVCQGVLNVLVWDRDSYTYNPVQINIT